MAQNALFVWNFVPVLVIGQEKSAGFALSLKRLSL